MIQQKKELSPEDIQELLKLTRKDITATKLKDYFAVKLGKEASRFLPNDTFTLRKGQFYNNTEIKTTIGRYIFNMFCLPEKYLKAYGYVNKTLNDDTIGEMEDKMGNMILEDKMTTKEYANFMDHSEWLGMSLDYFIAPSLTLNMVLPIPEVIKRRDELFDQYKEELAAGDNNAVNKIEKELLSMAKDKVQKLNDPSYDLFGSGVFNFGVAYKKCSIMIGAISNPLTNKLDVLKSNYVDGVSMNEYDKAAALTTIGGMSRGVATQKYGYETKKYNAGLQNVLVDVDGSNIDCGTQLYLDYIIDPSVKKLFLYRYVIDGSKLVELTPEVIDNYVGRPIKLRSPMFCKGDTICEHCAGSLYKRMNLEDVGLVASNMTGSLLNLSMKKMHDSTVKIDTIDINKYITER